MSAETARTLKNAASTCKNLWKAVLSRFKSMGLRVYRSFTWDGFKLYKD